ncbi:NADH-quinone oxidoreductase subunit L [uncultured Thiothrix sp.]|uniref:NADH-quinone oxidoreductase subunit L n=1 Tax=uncultured Thiothrix sp. TaxID=223185 RepID=UPI00261A7C6B|nr:NADH-quinone oxidoreductase subunit L [uncultured Thiothrix sp.]HMT91445.1 NADH-quinone oxidoreductase subunit L [Thiolinea sp.]
MSFMLVLIVIAPLLASMVVGLFGHKLAKTWSHRLTTGSVALSFLLSLFVFKVVALDGVILHENVYLWAEVDSIKMQFGFLIDNLSVLMMVVVTFVSLMVHIYTIGYMHDDPGYTRFFSYISLFTFAMLLLVMSNNFLQLFFGWELVGLVSYLLIGFWYKKETAAYASMKAFIVNRIGDFGFILGIAVIVGYTSTFDYIEVFSKLGVSVVKGSIDSPLDPLTQALGLSNQDLIALLLFIGAMGKSAQVPLHVWLPDSMEGPTPISALIHAATMVTAGIFLVARMSPFYEQSDMILNFILIIGATTAFFMGLIAIVQTDIKRVVAYSTLSQLGYMTVALGASAYSAAIFHLMTHAFFKALLFLAAGSVIVAMHHEQDMRKMGGLRRHMPITYWTAVVGALALSGIPVFSGFFSKDLIIEAVHHSELPAASYAYVMVLLGVIVTAFYTFRMIFMVFHGDERMDDSTLVHLKESPRVITIPLVVLAVPSILAGFFIGPIVMGDFFSQVLVQARSVMYGSEDVTTIMVNSISHQSMLMLRESYHGVLSFIGHGLSSLPFWLALAGIGLAWWVYVKDDTLADKAHDKLPWLYRWLDNKYYIDSFNQKFFANGLVYLGTGLWSFIDRLLIDGLLVNGVGRVIGWSAGWARKVQTGYVYHYAFAMVVGLALMLGWILLALRSA